MSVCRCVGVTLLCDTSVGGRPGQARQESRIEMLHPPLPLASDRFWQATGMKNDSLGAKDFRWLYRGYPGSDFPVSGFPIHCPTAVNGQRSTTANGQQRPVSKPERLLEPLALALEPCRAEPCFSTETRDTRHEIRDTRHETRAQESRTQEPKNPKIQEPKNPEPKNPEPKNPESMIKVDHYVARRALPGDSDDASVCRFSCVRRKV